MIIISLNNKSWFLKSYKYSLIFIFIYKTKIKNSNLIKNI